FTDRLQLLSLAQGGLGLSMLADLCSQADIGRVQLNPKPQSLCENRLRYAPARESATAKTIIIAARAVSAIEPVASKRKATGRLAERRKASSVGRCGTLSTTAPAHIPPITKIKKVCPSPGIAGNNTAPPRPQHRPASREPRATRIPQGADVLNLGSSALILPPKEPSSNRHERHGT